MSSNDNHAPTAELDIAGVPIAVRGRPIADTDDATRAQIEAEIQDTRFSIGVTALALAAHGGDCGASRRLGSPMSQPDPAARVIDECIDPGTRLILLKFDGGTFEATPWQAARFKLPGYIGLTRPRSARCRGRRHEGGASMDAKAKRTLLGEWLAKLQRDMDLAVEQMPEDWDETELAWYLVHRAEMFTRTSDRLRRKAYERAVKSRRL
jgi:hypothetical protein